jgi:CBS domain-containing protein
MANISEFMASELVTVDPHTTVADAAAIMGQKGVGSTLVMESERLLGIFTERDLVRAVSQHSYAPRHLVSDYMTPDPTTIQPGATAEQAMDMMLSRGFRHLPVEEQGKVVGIISMRDLSRILQKPGE